MKASLSRLPTLLSVSEAAAHLGVCTRTIRRIIATGELPITRVGRRIRIIDADLGVYLARGRGICPQVSSIGRALLLESDL